MLFTMCVPRRSPRIKRTLFSGSRVSSSFVFPTTWRPATSGVLRELILLPFAYPTDVNPPLAGAINAFAQTTTVEDPNAFLSRFKVVADPSG